MLSTYKLHQNYTEQQFLKVLQSNTTLTSLSIFEDVIN